MFVCICNGYRESELRSVAQLGIGCALEAYDALGKGPCCGRCLDCAQQIIDREHEATGALLSGPCE
jgi:bacterioferritin-associated ferredoxin